MNLRQKIKKLTAIILAFILLFSGVPSDKLVDYISQKIKDRNVVDLLYLAQEDKNVIDNGLTNLLKPHIREAKAANFQMQTGYYMGTGGSKSITGVGFQPQFLVIKSNNNAGVAVFKTSAMTSSSTAFFSATADNTASQLTLNSDGFTVGTLANTSNSNVRYTWAAFAGSDCSATGTFCVGQYTGNGSSPRTITTGFQPTMVIVKRTTAVASHFRTASHPANRTSFLVSTADDTAGSYIQSFASNGFTVGATDNTSSAVYNYIAFKDSTGVFKQGTYTGNATDNTNITGVGFTPDFVIVKNSTNATASNRNPLFNLDESYGNSSSHIGAASANVVGAVKTLQSDGFQLGTSALANGTGDTLYYAAFAGSGNYSSSGTFTMDTGSYTGTGSTLNVTGLSFRPDLVIIKDGAANYGVFRTGVMNGDFTAYLANGAAGFTGGITAINSDGFTIGTSTVVNTASNTYQWQAFGGAFNTYTNSGAEDFAIGAYYGNGIDNRSITRLPWQPNFVAVKRNSTTAGAWRTSSLSGDLSSFFTATAEAANNIQALNSDGFQVGTAANVNSSGSVYHWFAFKTGTNFYVGNHTGTGSDNTDVTSPAFQPDLVWMKRSAAVAGVTRPSSLAGDATQYFLNTANAAGRIKSFISNGFRLGTQTEVNTSGGTYRYAVWKEPVAVSVSVTITTDGTIAYGTLGPGESKSTITLSDTQTAQNDGNVAEDLNIKTDAPAGWSLGSSSSTDTFVHELSTNGGSNWTQFATADVYQTLVSNIAAGGTQNFDLRFTAPNPSNSTTQKTITITVQAVQH